MFIEIKNLYESICNGIGYEKIENRKLFIRKEDIRLVYGTETNDEDTMTKIILVSGEEFYTDMFIDDIIAVIKEK